MHIEINVKRKERLESVSLFDEYLRVYLIISYFTCATFHNGKKKQQFLHSRLIFYIKTLRF